ncbi:putative zinc finger protein 839 [Scophthalmus maximus]|uniref:Putative zinc finger protein 839 n=1 Tax=Scophthalmus maximus TaxID=52904 RepID=A0A2U9CIT2_SCOMX|nr:putative zinc finger protein 839 [Scophthalmus maximus]
MADNEDDSGPIGTIPEPPAATCTQSPDRPEPADHNGRPADSSQTVFGAGSEESGESLPSGSGAQLADFLQRCPEEQSILVGTELTALGPDLVNTTIIYVQPDGSLVEGSGLTAEEQQALLEQLTRQQLVQVSDTEATQLLQQSQLVKTIPVHNAALDPSQLQQVINQVTKSKQQVHVQVPQQQVQVHQQNPKTTNQNNASQQLKSVAQQVAMQTGSVQQVQKKSEPVRIQIKVPPKQEVKPSIALQQKNVCVNHPQVKLSANGSLSSAQIIHIQPVIGQQGQQFFLQQSPGDPPIQLLLQSPAPVVGSLLPLVHKLTGPTTSKASGPGQKPAAPPSTFKTVATSIIKTLPTSTPASVPLIEPINGMTTAARKSPAKALPVITPAQSTAVTRPPAASPPPRTPAAKDREEKKKLRKREKKMAKVQTRSGRVSRPPKYKAKDYKFIKTEDLADSHQSDSDDYSDMSEEEEGVRKDGPAPGSSSSLTYSHKSRSHRCQTCDKAYIGPGGLNRHYKLNPTHGDPDPPGNRPDNTPRPLGDVSHSQETTVTEEKPAAMATNRVGDSSTNQQSFNDVRVTVGLVSRRGRRGRPPKISVTTVTSEQQVDRRRDRLRELVEQCEDEELMDIVLPRLTKVLSLWELLLAKVECGGTARTRFPDIYREYESLQVQVKQAAQDYIISPQGGATPLEVRNIEVARSLGIMDEVNRMKVVPGACPSSSMTNKNVRYMENSKMLPPSKRFKMENSVPVHQNGIEMLRTGGTKVTPVTSSLKSCSVSVSHLVIPEGSDLLTTTTDSASSSTSAKTPSTEALPPDTPMEVCPCEGPLQTEAQVEPLPADQDQVLSTPDIAAQTKEPQEALGSSPKTATDTKAPDSVSAQTPGATETSTVQTLASQLQQRDSSQSESSTTDACEAKELQEGQEIYIQTEGLTVQLAEPGSDRIVIVNGPDGTTMHIQTPDGVPLEAVQALLGIEASDGNKVPH